MGWGGRGTHAAPRRLWGEPASFAAWRPRVIRASAHSWGAATPESTVGGGGEAPPGLWDTGVPVPAGPV